MAFNTELHLRKSTRLKGYDYSQPGNYLVTIYAKNRVCLFGSVDDGTMNLNDAGKMIKSVWDGLPERYPHVKLDRLIIMPNHIHGIIRLRPHSKKSAEPLGDIVDTFITLSTHEYIVGVREHDWLRFKGKLWQHNYHDRIISDDGELRHIRRYIKANPENWDTDPDSQPVQSKQGE